MRRQVASRRTSPVERATGTVALTLVGRFWVMLARLSQMGHVSRVRHTVGTTNAAAIFDVLLMRAWHQLQNPIFYPDPT